MTQLQQVGARVRILDRTTPHSNIRGVEIYLGDFRDEKLLDAALEGKSTSSCCVFVFVIHA